MKNIKIKATGEVFANLGEIFVNGEQHYKTEYLPLKCSDVELTSEPCWLTVSFNGRLWFNEYQHCKAFVLGLCNASTYWELDAYCLTSTIDEMNSLPGVYYFALNLETLGKLLEFMQQKEFNFSSLRLERACVREMHLINEVVGKYGLDID